MRNIKIGLVGFGTIGAGVVKALQSKRSLLRDRAGVDISIAKICDQDIRSKRPVKVPKKLLTKSIGKILYDPQIDIVVELVGGIHPAKDILLEALRQGKHVITANKALLSEAGDEVFGLANKLGLLVGFEGSVGGGIPIIKALKEGFVSNRIELIYGIINGTTNFILSTMAESGSGFKKALELAQKLGYAERDPSLDINGIDSCHKLSILALLGFGVHIRPDHIYTEGIADIDFVDIEYAKEQGYAIKLLAIAKRSGDLLELGVHPTLIPAGHLLSNVNGVYNAIFVKGDLIGDNVFYGRGAGASPTSSAVLADIVDIAKHMQLEVRMENTIIFKKDIAGLKHMGDVTSRYYVRFSAVDKPGVLAKISGILGKHNISIATVAQKGGRSSKVAPIVMMTHDASERSMARAIKEIDALDVIRKKSVRVRVEE